MAYDAVDSIMKSKSAKNFSWKKVIIKLEAYYTGICCQNQKEKSNHYAIIVVCLGLDQICLA